MPPVQAIIEAEQASVASRAASQRAALAKRLRAISTRVEPTPDRDALVKVRAAHPRADKGMKTKQHSRRDSCMAGLACPCDCR